MRVISRYISLEFAKIIAICLGAFVAIYLVIDFFERIDDFLEAKLPLFLALHFFILKLPLVLEQGIPMSVLMGALVTLGLMSRNNELMVLKASGIGPALIVGPIVALALVASIFDFALSEYVVPLTSIQTNHIWNVKVMNRPSPTSFSEEKVWYKSGQVIYNIRVLHPKRGLLEGVTIHIFDGNFRLAERIDARRAVWDGHSWIFSDGIFVQRTNDGNFTAEHFQRRRIALEERPQDFQHLEKASEEMTLAELARYVAEIESEGYDSTRYRVDFYGRIAFPFTSLIMALLGIGVALYQGKKGGIAVGVAASVALAFVYFLIFQLTLSIGYTGNLHPMLAAWMPNILFGIASMYIFSQAMH
ncbi:MAG: LPS export ABC transporter permease LptG [Deltaproteobacteria bacterium]|nr:LPS export ABC transporter permease LptG [Deltaproteobacteria bacterium]